MALYTLTTPPPKAPEHRRTPKPGGTTRRSDPRGSVLECVAAAPFSETLPIIRLLASLSTHARTENSVAARSVAPTLRAWLLFRHCEHLPKGTSLSWRESPGSFAPGSAHCGSRLWLATRSLGGVLEPLPLRWPSTRSRARRHKSFTNARRVAHENFGLGKQTRQDAGTTSLVQFPRDTAYVSEVVSGAIELRASESGEASAGTGGQPVSVVLGEVVLAHHLDGDGEIDLPIQDGLRERGR